MATKAMKTYAGLVGLGSFVENKTGGWRTFKPVKDDSKCNMCLFCWFYCPEGCIIREENKLRVDYDYCKGCGICANECPKKAIQMVRE
ncbi:MAG: 4Fe-4S binding protein [Candidatus Thermoplasmatota archaeon]